MLGTIPKTFSNDTLDMSSVDSMSLDEHIEIKIPEARARENRLMAQNNFVQHINEKSKNGSNFHLAVENGLEMIRNNSVHPVSDVKVDNKEHNHIHRSHSHASMKRVHGLTPNGINHVNGHDHKLEQNKIKK